MATLTNTKIKDTYDGLLKTTDNEALDASGVTLIEDGLGNASALSVGRSGNGVSVSGDLAVDTNTLYVNATSDFVGIGTSNQTVNGEILRIAGDVFINSTGTASVPSIALADTNSGFFAPSAGQVAITTQGVERLRIDSSGNVGINEQNPNISGFSRAITLGGADSGYEIANSGVITAIFSGNAQGASISGVGSSGIRFRTSASGATTERMRIDSSGNVGIGTSSPAVPLHTVGESLFEGRLQITSATPEILFSVPSGGLDSRIHNDGSGNFIFGTGTNSFTPTERMRIDNAGRVLFGTTAEPNGTSVYGAGFSPISSDRMFLRTATSTTASSNLIGFYNPNGLVGSISTSGTSTSYTTSSDYRLKENVVEMTGALDRVDALKPSRFNFIADPEKTVDGFLAHEVAEVVPEAITGEKDAVDEEGNPVYQAIDQSKIVPLLVGAIKELSAKVAALESQLNA